MLADITATGVRQAIAEYDALGREVFLQKYGFHRSRGYVLHAGGRTYDSNSVIRRRTLGKSRSEASGSTSTERAPERHARSRPEEHRSACLSPPVGFACWSLVRTA